MRVLAWSAAFFNPLQTVRILPVGHACTYSFFCPLGAGQRLNALTFTWMAPRTSTRTAHADHPRVADVSRYEAEVPVSPKVSPRGGECRECLVFQEPVYVTGSKFCPKKNEILKRQRETRGKRMARIPWRQKLPASYYLPERLRS